jgi:hypothetical protein
VAGIWSYDVWASPIIHEDPHPPVASSPQARRVGEVFLWLFYRT